jgi:hypothetical protein
MLRARAGLGSAICCSLGRLAQRHHLSAAAGATLPVLGASLGRRRRFVFRPTHLPDTTTMSATSAAAGGGPRPGAQQQGEEVAVRDRVVLSEQEEALFATLLAAARAAGTGTVLRAAGGWVRDKLLGRASVDIDIALDNMYGKDFAEKVRLHFQLVQTGGCVVPSPPPLALPANLVTPRPPPPPTKPLFPLPQINEYLASQGIATHSTAVIQSNPDQSKHLETARIKVPVLPGRTGNGGGNGGGGGIAAASAAPALWIDLVNLRSETYAEGSRIPTMEFGTPQQDAERR